MKLKDLQEEYGEFEVQDGFMDFLKKPSSEDVWNINVGDVVYVLNRNGGFDRRIWEGTYDKYWRDQGNIVFTREEAIFKSRCREFATKVERFAYEFSDEDWEDCDIPKWHCAYTFDDNEIFFHFACGHKLNQLYFKSMDDIEKTIEYVGRDNFIKYYLCANKQKTLEEIREELKEKD